MKIDSQMTPEMRRRRCLIYAFRLVGFVLLAISIRFILGSPLQLIFLSLAIVLFLLSRAMDVPIRST